MVFAIYLVYLALVGYFFLFSGLFAGLITLVLGIGIINYFSSLEHRIVELETELKIRSSPFVKPYESASSSSMFAQESVEDRAQETEPKTEDVYNKPLTKPIKISKLTQKNDLSKAFEPPAESLPYAVNSLRSTTTNDAPTLELEPKIVAFVQGLVERVKTTLFEMNPIATIGVVILFIGVSFLLKYASAYIHFSIERRLLTVAAVGIIGSILGLRLHLQKPVFANILQGCSVGLLFLTTYASFKVYGLLPPVVAFGLLIGIVVYSSIISVVQNAKSLAILGVLGGFFSPILISTGEDNFVLLFSYYTVLNLGILGLAWFKTWSDLNLVGFIFTFILSSLWGWQSYQPDYFYTVEFFLMLFFLFYVVIAMLYAEKKEKQGSYYIDAIITIGTPFITLALQAGLVARWQYGLAYSALAFGIFYTLLAVLIYKFCYPALKSLVKVYSALALIFATASIPLASTGNWAVVSWAFEGLVLMYLGIKEQQLRLRVTAFALEIGSGFMFIFHYGFIYYLDFISIRSCFDIMYLTAGIIGFASIICSCMWYNFEKERSSFELAMMQLLFLWGLLWWYINGVMDVQQHTFIDHVMLGYTLFFAASSAIFWTLSEPFQWVWLRFPALALLPMMVLLELYSLVINLGYDTLLLEAWLISFVVLYGILYRHEKIAAPYLSVLHSTSMLLLTCVIADQASRMIHLNNSLPMTWRFIAWGIVPSLLLCLINQKIIPYLNRYSYVCGGILSVFIIGWTLISYSLSGDMSPLPYIPVLNPLELLEAFALFTSISWVLDNEQVLKESLELTRKVVFIQFSMLVFLLLSIIALRTVHHCLAIPYTAMDLWQAQSVQTTLSIFWMILALTATFIAARKHSRILWFGGFALIGVIIVKLFFVDLIAIGSLERILTFISVGILMLINGYISPMPPKENSNLEKDKK